MPPAAVENQEDTPETESRGEEVVAEDATKNANANGGAVDGAETAGADNPATNAEEQKTTDNNLAQEEEEDPFQQLPERAPYQDPPVFRGHTNYGFEFYPMWAEVGEPDKQSTDDGLQSESESGEKIDDDEVEDDWVIANSSAFLLEITPLIT